MYDFKKQLAENDVAGLRLYVESHNSVARKHMNLGHELRVLFFL